MQKEIESERENVKYAFSHTLLSHIRSFNFISRNGAKKRGFKKREQERGIKTKL